MAGIADAKSEWILRVLGIDVAGEGDGTAPAVDPPLAAARPAKTVSLRAVAKCRLEWLSTVKDVRGQAQRLKLVVMQELKDAEEFTPEELAEAETKLGELDTMVAGIDESLAELLDDVINAAPGPKRLAAQESALAQTARYLQFANTNEAFDLVDENEYLVTNVKSLTLDGLTAIQDALAEAA